MTPKKFLLAFILLLVVGLTYRLLVVSNGNFIFNMDNARDLIDVREMVVLQKMRLIGPTSGIEGFFNGPAWYYLLAIPFIITSGSPFSMVILMMILWIIGGFFLLKLVSRFGFWITVLIGFIWAASNYLTLVTTYSYNPNPVVLLTPLFIFLLVKYLESSNFVYIAGAWFLSGLFFNFEMNFGIFMPVVILLAIVLSKKIKLLKTKQFWLGFMLFLVTILPQLLFEFRHNFFMTKSVLVYLTSNHGFSSYSLTHQVVNIGHTYWIVLSATFMNKSLLVWILLAIGLFLLAQTIRQRKWQKDSLLLVVFLMILVPFLGQILLPVKVMLWHVGGAMAASVILVGFLIKYLLKIEILGKIAVGLISILIITAAWTNLSFAVKHRLTAKNISADPAVFRNEIAAIDYVYQKAQGKNFKVYIYLPSVMDYPYQYLFWWYGQKKYGYLPKDYAYLPDKPTYINSKERFQNNNDPTGSGLVFLIEQPDQRGERHLWENSFTNLPKIKSDQVGPLLIETRTEIINN